MPQTAPKTDTSTFREIRSAHEAGAPSANRRGGVGVSGAGAKKTGASFARGGSRQDYSTPKDFIDAVEARWGALDFDLAAVYHNAIARRFFGPPREIAGYDVSNDRGCEGINSLAQTWSLLAGNLWLNPPFDRIAPWAEKCARWRAAQSRGRIFFLIPAAVGSNWFRDYVHDVARVYFLNGRLSFDGKNHYPKDCLLAIYSSAHPGYEVWNWRERR